MYQSLITVILKPGKKGGKKGDTPAQKCDASEKIHLHKPEGKSEFDSDSNLQLSLS